MLKVIWMCRAIIYKLAFGKFGFLSYIGPVTYLSGVSHLFFGKKVRIYPHARIESLGGRVVIGDNVSIGQNIHIISTQEVFIGKDTTISSNVFISDTDHCYTELGKHIMEQPVSNKKTIISDNCFIGFGVAILPGSILGKQCVVGANSVVKGSYPDYSVIVGSPAVIVKRFDLKTNSWRKTKPCGKFIENNVF
ncbi:acyltransferase [Aeromonas hydrophila]|uniref:acyltransferase n=1 Tax=Aeromonas hydrophila TaxID=644 RepID=UPI0009BC1B0B|nr:acyltransferase [Aeromonas hydrophila]ELM3749663.1 acyltransferase [Aeromonas dhakensis]QGZ72380.1 acyltransferase [Aeromonas hydrophila]HEB5079633.1 acyltransferase [Aeromonas hydrophila subsp. hydrophila]